MTTEEGLAVLTDVLGDDRVAAENGAASRLVALCDHLPLALRIVAARLATHPQWTIRYVGDELADEQERLYGLATEDGEISVAATLRLTYQVLPPSAAGMFRMLGVHPGDHVDVHAAAAVGAVDRIDAQAALTTLASFHLVHEFVAGRFNQHDLIRLYGEQVAAEDVPPADQRTATSRLLDFYLATSAIARRLATTGTFRLHGPVDCPPTSTPELTSLAAALAWFRLEERNVRALLLRAGADALHEQLWKLVDNIFLLYYRLAQYDSLLWSTTIGLRAARQLEDRIGVLRMSVRMTAAIRVVQGAEHARPFLHAVTEEFGDVADPLHRYDILGEFGRCSVDLGDLSAALRYHGEALELAQSAQQPMLVATEHNELAWTWALRGQFDRAITHSEQALTLLSARPMDPLLAPALHTYATVLEKMGRDDEAMNVYQEALDAAVAQDNEHGQARYHETLGDLAHRLGADDLAAARRAAAADIYDAIGMPSAARRAREASRATEDSSSSTG